MSKQTLQFVVSGRVQGVFFRASCRTEALRLGLRGSAVNRADGAVEVLARGDAAALRELHRWLQAGPPLARVDTVTVVVSEQPVAPGFHTG